MQGFGIRFVKSLRARGRAFALITVISTLAMVMVMLLGLFGMAATEVKSANNFKHTLEAKALSEVATNMVIAQIRRATFRGDGAPPTVWSSQPGALHTWDESGASAARAGLLLRTVPNPFRTMAGVRYHLPAGTKVRLAVYDVAGRRVRMLVDRECGPGWHSDVWDGRDEEGEALPSGVYFMALEVGSQHISKKCVLVR